MGLLKDIIHWFIYGSNGQTLQPEPAAPTHSQSNNGHIPKKRAPVEEFDLNNSSYRGRFLDELRSIEPLSKQFSTAREDMLRELKKMGDIKSSSRPKNA